MIKLDLNYIKKCFLSVFLIAISFTSYSKDAGETSFSFCILGRRLAIKIDASWMRRY